LAGRRTLMSVSVRGGRMALLLGRVGAVHVAWVAVAGVVRARGVVHVLELGVAEVEPSVAEVELSVAEVELSVAEVELSVAEVELSVAEVELSVDGGVVAELDVLKLECVDVVVALVDVDRWSES
jgi:hypothetical protein